MLNIQFSGAQNMLRHPSVKVRKEVEKAMNKLKANGSIISPKRCFWEPAK